MKFRLNPDHSIWALTQHVAQQSKEFMKAHDLSYFQYLRCYSDGSIACLLNTTELFKSMIARDLHVLSSFDESHEKRPSYVFFWDEELPILPVSLAREKHGMHHGVTLVKRHKNFYDMIAFAMGKPKSNAMAYYFNHLKVFEKLAADFVTIRSDLFSICEKDKLSLPQKYQDPNCTKICLPDKPRRFQVKGKSGDTYLTAQEIFCMQLLNQGKSYKEISKELSIAERTIETYLDRVKVRTGYQTREQILGMLSLCP